MDDEIKREALGESTPNGTRMQDLLAGVTNAYGAQGTFVVGQDGIVRSSWDSSGKPSTGLNVKFRPYFKMALQGKENVYAAVSLARGDRALYFTAPIFAGRTRGDEPVGGVVTRTDLKRIDAALNKRDDIALLLSPQGVVFASGRPEWIGFLAARPSPEQLKAIRELKQFGNMFENKEPTILPVSLDQERVRLDGRSFAVAGAAVQWNDPSGDWQLVLMEDLSRSVPWGPSLWVGAGAAFVLLLLTFAARQMLSSHYAQQLSSQQLAAYAQAQELAAERKTQLNAAALRIQQAESVADLARMFLVESHGLLGALQGVVYIVEPGGHGRMRLAASYACPVAVPDTLEPGEGLLGQCALEWITRIVATPEDGIWNIHSGLGSTRPAALVMAPIVLHDALQGVVEIALLEVPGEDLRAQFGDMLNLLGLNLEIVRRTERAAELLNANGSDGS
jgi:hypothetical protein